MAIQNTSKPGFWKRLVKRSLILTGTGATIAFAIALVSVGGGLIAARAADTTEVTDRAPTPVSLARLEQVASYQYQARFTGTIEPARSTNLGFELGGTLSEILVDEGDAIDEGQVIARLDTRALEADRAAQVAAIEAAIARRDIAKLTADRQSELAARDFASSQRRDEARFNLIVAEAEISSGEAALAAIDVAITKSKIVAPYDGVISDRRIDQGARVGPNQTILSIQDQQVLMRVGLPEAMYSQVSIGDTLDVFLSSDVVEGTVTRLRPDLDPVTRTRSALIALPNSVSPVTGTLGEITLTRSVNTPGAWVPLSALSEGVDGLWTLFIVPPGSDSLDRIAVTLEHVAQDQAFVSGAFPELGMVVTAGTHRLSPGQTVIAAGEG